MTSRRSTDGEDSACCNAAELRSRSIEVAIARLADKRAQEEAGRTGLIAALGPERVFKSVDEAVRRIGPGAKA